MIEKPVGDINETDLLALVTNGRSEGRRLDFKRDLPGNGESEIRDFLGDVISFANTDGGDLIMGIDEDGNGTAASVPGVPSAGLDEIILGLESRVRDCIDVRLPQIFIHPVPLENGRSVLVIRIPASLLAPHRYSYRKISRFCARNSRGTYEMDTTELRNAFAGSEAVPAQLRALHDRAVLLSQGGDMPCELDDGPKFVLTVTPLSVLREVRDVDVGRENALLPPLAAGGIHLTTGLEGVIGHAQAGDHPRIARGWSYNHRRGYIDLAWIIGRELGNRNLVWPRSSVDVLEGAIRSAIARLMSYRIEGPWVAMATLIDIRGHRAILSDEYYTDEAWQDRAYLGQIMSETLDTEALAPIVASFWRVFGLETPPRRTG